MKGLGLNFWLFRYSQIMTKMGYYSSSFAILWWVLDNYRTASSVTLIIALPMLTGIMLKVILSPLGDSLSKKTLILTGTLLELLACGAVTILLWRSALNLNSLLFLEVFATVGASLCGIGSIGILPVLVSRDQLLSATRIITGIDSFVALTSASAGGIMVSWFGVVFSYFLTSSLMVLSFAFLLPVKLSEGKKTSLVIHVFTGMAGDFRMGALFTIKNKITRILFVYSLLIGIAFSCLQISVPYIVKMVNYWPASYLGFITASLASGVVISSFLAGTLSQHIRNSRLIWTATAGFCLSSVILSTNPYVVFYGACYFMMGVSKNVVNIIVDTRLLSSLPEDMRTKVLSNLFFCSNISMPLSMLISGKIIDNTGPLAIMACVVISFITALILIATNPTMTRFFDSDDAQLTRMMSTSSAQEVI